MNQELTLLLWQHLIAHKFDSAKLVGRRSTFPDQTFYEIEVYIYCARELKTVISDLMRLWEVASKHNFTANVEGLTKDNQIRILLWGGK